ncbi:MAG: hypothetical protein GY797_00830 [Deltaproteobacteria bacterium]|nr:hypothetical protein [Deltaproteobacteria bacterium]
MWSQDKPDDIGNEPNELHTIKIQFKPFKEEAVENEIFKINLTQYQAVDGKDIATGGQQFVFKPVVEEEPVKPEKPTLSWIIVVILVVIVVILLIIIIFRKPKR